MWIWLVFIGTVLLAAVSVELGYQWAKRKKDHELEKEAPVGAMVGAVLGLLAFLLAVTFGIAADTFIARKRALIEEANAIRTAYMRTALIGEPQKTEVRQLFREYVNARLQWVGIDTNEQSRPAEVLLQKLWNATAIVGRQNPNSEVTALFIDGVNNVAERHHERLMIRERTRIPGAFWLALYSVAFLALGAMGYHCGVAGTVRSPVMVVVAVAFAAVIVLIVDIDQPGAGLVEVNQQSMVDVRDSLVAGTLDAEARPMLARSSDQSPMPATAGAP